MEKVENVTNELCDAADMPSPSTEEMCCLTLGINAKCERKEIIFSGLHINLLILRYWTVICIVMPKKSAMEFSLNKRKHKQTKKPTTLRPIKLIN